MMPLACLLVGAALASHHTSPNGAGPDSTQVPMELVGASRAVVLTTLNGKGPYRLLVETGSPHVQLTSPVLTALRLSPAGMDGADSLFRLDSLRVGGVVVPHLAVGRGDEVRRLGADGVLGLDAYAGLLLTLDYPAGRLSLTRDTLPKPDGAEVLSAVRVGPFIGVAVDLAGRKAVGVLDTQGGVLVQAVPAVAERLPFEQPLQVVGRAFVGGAAPVEVQEGRLAGDMTIGRQVFRRPRIAVHMLPPDIPSQVTIGADALRHFRVTIDQQSMRVRLTRADTAAIAG
ncbi:MAG: hypothetical protein ACTHM9_10675 [Gemmatimonadales bacterium]